MNNSIAYRCTTCGMVVPVTDLRFYLGRLDGGWPRLPVPCRSQAMPIRP